MIVPQGGHPLRYSIDTLWLKIAAGAAALIVVIVLISIISFARLFSKAMERDRLAAENERLRAENRRIVALSQEVEQNRKALERIVKSLGGKLELDMPEGEDLK